MTRLHLLLAAIHARSGADAFPLGAACLAAAARAEPTVDIEIMEFLATDAPGTIAWRMADARPDAAGIGLYAWNRDLGIAVARLLRTALPGIILIAGGPEASARAEGLGIDAGGPFDSVVAGDGETVIVEYCRRLAAGESLPAFFRAPPAELGKFPSPWLNPPLALSGRAGALWELARGCPYTCAYCYEAKGENRVRYTPEERLAAELRVIQEAGVESVFVLDPTFNADAGRADKLLELIEKDGKGIHWHFEIRAERLTRSQARRFAALGASLQIGLQTADPEVAARINRPLSRGGFAAKIGLLNDEGAVFGLDLIYGLPGDNLSGYLSSLDFALGLYPNSLDLFRLSLLPGTPLYDQAATYGLAADPESPYLLRSSPTFSATDLGEAERVSEAANLFYNAGRAVAWFNQVLHPLKIKPSAFLRGFADFLAPRRRPWYESRDPVGLEKLQLEYLTDRFERAKIDYYLPAVWDLVRFHGAWGRALAEGIATQIEFNYDPNEILSPEAMDLERFVTLADRRPNHAWVRPGEKGPSISY